MADGCLLYYITDRTQFPGDERARRDALLCKIVEAVQADVNYIQLREKDLITCELETLARVVVGLVTQLRAENRGLRTRILINSRTDVALVVGADGVHLRSDDVSPVEVRRIWTMCGEDTSCGAGVPAREKPVITVACHTKEDVTQAEATGADMAIFAPVFEKKDRPETRPIGLNALREACRAKIPVLALGGVTLKNAAACLEAGAAGIAAIRLFQENRIEDVVRAVRQIGEVKSKKSN